MAGEPFEIVATEDLFHEVAFSTLIEQGAQHYWASEHLQAWNLKNLLATELTAALGVMGKAGDPGFHQRAMMNLSLVIMQGSNPLAELLSTMYDDALEECRNFADGKETVHTDGMPPIKTPSGEAVFTGHFLPESLDFYIHPGSPHYHWIAEGQQPFLKPVMHFSVPEGKTRKKTFEKQTEGITAHFSPAELNRLNAKLMPPRPYVSTIIEGICRDYQPGSGNKASQTNTAILGTVQQAISLTQSQSGGAS